MNKAAVHRKRKARFSAADKVKALEREIAKRRAVYPGKIGRGMTAAKARFEIGVMESIRLDYLRCTFCLRTMADWHDPEPIAGSPGARMAVRLHEHEGLFVCQKCKPTADGSISTTILRHHP